MVSGLRSDHVVVSVIAVTSKDFAKKEIMVEGNDLDGRLDNVKVLSLCNLMEYGYQDLKADMCSIDPGTETLYNFHGQSVDRRLHSVAATKVIASFITAEAYPGPWNTLTTTASTSLETVIILRLLVDHHLAIVVQDDQYQLTAKALAHIRWRRSLNNFKPFFRRRTCPAAQWSTWELLDYLEEQGWEALPYAPRVKVAPLVILDTLKEHQKVVLLWQSH